MENTKEYKEVINFIGYHSKKYTMKKCKVGIEITFTQDMTDGVYEYKDFKRSLILTKSVFGGDATIGTYILKESGKVVIDAINFGCIKETIYNNVLTYPLLAWLRNKDLRFKEVKEVHTPYSTAIECILSPKLYGNGSIVKAIFIRSKYSHTTEIVIDNERITKLYNSNDKFVISYLASDNFASLLNTVYANKRQ